MNLLRKLIDKNDPASLKGFVALTTTLHFIVSAFVILALVIYAALYIMKGSIDKILVDLLGEILKYDFYIIATAIFGNSIDKVALIFAAKSTPQITEELKDT